MKRLFLLLPALALALATPASAHEEKGSARMTEPQLHGHLAMTTDAVVAKLHKDTARAIVAYDKGHEHVLMVADVLSAGIVKQFPARFGP